MILGTAVCAAVLGMGIFMPVRLKVKQTGTLHQYTALTEEDFDVQTSTLFGIDRETDDYKVVWGGWTEEAQKDLLTKLNGGEENISDGSNDEQPGTSDSSKEERPDASAVSKEEQPDASDVSKAEQPDASDGSKEEQPDAADRSKEEKSESRLVVTGETVTEYTITRGSLSDTVTAEAVPMKEIRAEYESKLYFMDTLAADDMHAYLVYEDGAEAEIPCTADEIGAVSETVDIPVHTDYGDTICHIEPITVKELTAKYKGKIYSGDTASADQTEVTAEFEDGHKTTVKASAFAGDAVVNESGEYRVSSIYGETGVDIDPIEITGASINVSGLLYEEDMLKFDTITLKYEDGKTIKVGKDEVELSPEADLPLTAGKNEIPFIYNGKMYTFTVDVLHDTEIRRATIRYAKEIETAEYSHLSETIMVTVNRYREAEYTYLLTHIIIDDPSQIHAGLSNDDYGGERETPSSAAKRLNWVVGINGSNFDYATNTPTMADAIIKNGQVMPDSKFVANGMEICLTNSGNLFSPQQGMTVNDLLNMGVTDTWCCGDTLLISNGEAVNVGIQSLDYRYPRTAIGMVRPCEYYLITAGEAGYSNGMTYDEIRDTLMSLDCGFGKCLDGGGSSTLIFEDKMLNSPATGSERPVTDFLYFTE